MKISITFMCILVSIPAMGADTVCPDLAGTYYHCDFAASFLSPFGERIDQVVIAQNADAAGITTYFVDETIKGVVTKTSIIADGQPHGTQGTAYCAEGVLTQEFDAPVFGHTASVRSETSGNQEKVFRNGEVLRASFSAHIHGSCWRK